MLTVAIDAEHSRQSAAGIARYAASLANALRQRGDVQVLELGGGPVVPRGSLRKKLLTARQDLLWFPILARRRAAQLGAQVYHSPLLRGPLSRGSLPFVMTVHDMVPLRWPDTMPRWHRFYTRAVLRRLLDAADRIIAPSANTADDIVALAGASPDRIRVVPNGVDAIFFTPPPAIHVRPDPYVLFVGTPEPRKNLHRLIAAIGSLRRKGFRERLVIVGAGGWGAPVGVTEFIDVLGRIPDEELLSLYANASCVALPSLHEGFGLPALEAMAAGAAVVAGASGALPEVTAGAAVLVDPMSSASIADGVVAAIANRADLVSKGKRRAQAFTWQRAADLTAQVYRELV